MRDLLIPGLPMFHDSNPHITRAIAVHQSLVDGIFPPVWAKEVLGGIGSPVLLLNYQLPYLLGELWHILGANYFDSYKLTLGITYIASGLLMYGALRSRFGKWGAWVGAVLYSLAPYRMVDIFVRGALGEAMSFIFPPLLLWGFAKHSYPLLILGWAGLFLTHPVAAALFSAFFLGASLINKISWKTFVIPYLVALLIASFNIIPTLAYTQLTYYSPALSDTLQMFPSLRQLIASPWGYGVSLPGDNDGMSFAVGNVQWLILCFFVLLVWKKRRIEHIYWLGMAIVNIILMLAVARPLYEWGLGSIIDFPWRLLLTLIFVVALMGAQVINKLSVRSWQLAAGMIISVALIGQTLPIAHTHDYWGPEHDEQFFARETGDSYGEYAPLSRSSQNSSPFGQRAEIVEGQARVDVLEHKVNAIKLHVTSEGESRLRINIAYFPGWQTRIDGKEGECEITQRTLPQIDDSGLVMCRVEAGEHVVEHQYFMLPLQKLGNLLTLTGIGVYLWILFRSFYLHITRQRR